jgi:hypothetical protein
MLTTQIQPATPGVLAADNLLSSADMSTYWNSQSSRVNSYATPRGTR